MGEIVEKID